MASTMQDPSSSNTIVALTETLQKISAELEAESNVKEAIKESLQPIETVSRSVTALLNRVHSTPADQLSSLAEQALSQISSSKPLWTAVAQAIPAHEYHRYQYQISFVLKALTTSIALAHFLLHDNLVTLEGVAATIGIEKQWSDRLALSADDYLQGVIGTSNELARLALNSVTLQNFTLPLRIATFEKELFAGFSLLNLRNDALRRRFDSLKYDVKRCEDVVYDISLRGLAGKGV